MTLLFIRGPAGSGKTTRLVIDVRARIAAAPLEPHQRVLALTRMHGSRRRMQSKLTGSEGVGARVDVVTMDSFALSLVRRWRSRLRNRGVELHSKTTFEAIAQHAASLLADEVPRAWLSSTFPIVVVDELQDCTSGHLEMLKGIVAACECFAAADEFQDLRGDAVCAAVEWAAGAGTLVDLSKVLRTNVAGLLSAAWAIRGRGSVESTGGFRILTAPTHHIAASFVANNLLWWSSATEIAIITPTGPSSSRFIANVFERLAAKAFVEKRSQVTHGPYDIPWERAHLVEERDALERLGLNDMSAATVDGMELARLATSHLPELAGWLDKQRRIAGRTTFDAATIREALGRLLALRRAFSVGRIRNRVTAMTVDQAKNREFHSVIILWPVELGGNEESVRRRLYNAVTRAKRQAVVIVQDPKPLNSRVAKPPFTMSTIHESADGR